MRYSDASAALEWLTQAFGFEELVVYRNDDGGIVHAEIALGPGIVMFSPGEPDPPSNPLSHGIYVAVDDPDAHYERAKAAGAEIVRELEDTPYESREYTARDLEGHVWSFGSYRPKAGT